MNDSTNPAARKLRYRKLRIVWSVGWGIACVLLIALWVRSYWRMDVADFSDKMLALNQGWLTFSTGEFSNVFPPDLDLSGSLLNRFLGSSILVWTENPRSLVAHYPAISIPCWCASACFITISLHGFVRVSHSALC
jgi:hypothetical protein